MADVAVKKALEQKPSGEKDLSRRTEGGWEPFSWLTPSDFFSNPFSLMRHLSEEMDRTFGRSWNREEGGSYWAPPIEVREHDGQLQVHAELPGLKPEDVKVELANDQLTIQGERKYEHQEHKKGLYRSERRYGHFYRAIPLPEGANTDRAKAQFNNGVLEVTLPVPEHKSNRRQIPIESSK